MRHRQRTVEPHTPYTTAMSPASPVRTRSAVWISVMMAATIAVICAGAWSLWYLLGRPAWEVQPLGVTLTSGGDPVAATENSADLCAIVACDEGWETTVGNYLLFAAEGDADYWAQAIGGDSLRNGRIVLDRNGFELDARQRSLSIDLLYPGHEW